MFDKKIFVTYDIYYDRAIEGLGETTTDVQDFMDNPDDFSLVLFTGGSDLSPEFYSESSPKYCSCDINRDLNENKIMDHAMANGIRTIGICRGLQLINVKAGGSLHHHIEGHRFGTHFVDCNFHTEFLVNSVHHQSVILPRNAHMIAWSKERLSNIYRGDHDLPVTPFPMYEIEGSIYPVLESAGVQWHPEAMPIDSKGYKFFYTMAKMLIVEEDFSKIVDYYTNRNTVALKNQNNFVAKTFRN